MASPVEQIKEKLDIVDVVASYLKLEKAGTNFKARCPFHNEKSPSFYVSPGRQTYHCFGCNRGGDVFTFVEEFEGIDFRGALKVLADRAGIDLSHERPDGKTKTEKEELYRLLDEATKHFEKNLRDDSKAIDYLKGRGVTGETAARFRIGYAKNEWRDLYDVLKKKGFTDPQIEKAGLAIRSTKGYYDRFRGRVMFPIAESSGRIVAYSGRILPGITTEGDKEPAKYVNSPETELFNKSKILFGFDKAKTEIRKADTCIIVEGQMDLVMSHQAGVANVVAASGTALTEEHVHLIARLADRIVFAFDSDAAGVNAAKRGIDIALAAGLEVRVAALSKEKDPADVIAKDPEAWKQMVGKTTGIIDFLLAAYPKHDERAYQKQITEAVLPYVARIPNSIDRAKAVAKIAGALGVREEPVWEELRKVRLEDTAPPERRGEETGSPPVRSRTDRVAEKIAGILLWQSSEGTPLFDTTGYQKQFREIVGDETFTQLMQGEEEEVKNRIFEAEIYYGGIDIPEGHRGTALEKEAQELLVSLETERLRESFAAAMASLRRAEQDGNEEEVKKILAMCQDISKKLGEIAKP